jgi:hypothetical protein
MSLRWIVVLLLVLGTGVTPAWARSGGADGEFEKRTSSHFVLLQDVDIDESGGLRGSRRFEDQVLAALESAYGDVDKLLGMRPRRSILVTVWDAAIFDARFAGLFRFPAAGFYGDSIHVRAGTVVDQRLVRVLHHELVHASFHAEAPSLVLPAWFNEGMSEWFEARATGRRGLGSGQIAYLQTRASSGELFSLAQLSAPSFGGFGPNAAGAAYLQSYAFFDYLGRTYGERRLRDLVRLILRTGDLGRAFERTFRSDLGELERDFAATLLR